jgi:hypothetical protein
MALDAGSPAIGAGVSTICRNDAVGNVDQRGFMRVTEDDSTCDSGAYEGSP